MKHIHMQEIHIPRRDGTIDGLQILNQVGFDQDLEAIGLARLVSESQHPDFTRKMFAKFRSSPHEGGILLTAEHPEVIRIIMEFRRTILGLIKAGQFHYEDLKSVLADQIDKKVLLVGKSTVSRRLTTMVYTHLALERFLVEGDMRAFIDTTIASKPQDRTEGDIIRLRAFRDFIQVHKHQQKEFRRSDVEIETPLQVRQWIGDRSIAVTGESDSIVTTALNEKVGAILAHLDKLGTLYLTKSEQVEGHGRISGLDHYTGNYTNVRTLEHAQYLASASEALTELSKVLDSLCLPQYARLAHGIMSPHPFPSINNRYQELEVPFKFEIHGQHLAKTIEDTRTCEGQCYVFLAEIRRAIGAGNFNAAKSYFALYYGAVRNYVEIVSNAIEHFRIYGEAVGTSPVSTNSQIEAGQLLTTASIKLLLTVGAVLQDFQAFLKQ